MYLGMSLSWSLPRCNSPETVREPLRRDLLKFYGAQGISRDYGLSGDATSRRPSREGSISGWSGTISGWTDPKPRYLGMGQAISGWVRISRESMYLDGHLGMVVSQDDRGPSRDGPAPSLGISGWVGTISGGPEASRDGRSSRDGSISGWKITASRDELLSRDNIFIPRYPKCLRGGACAASR